MESNAHVGLHAGILGGECAAALAGGINIMLWHDVTAGICALQVLTNSAFLSINSCRGQRWKGLRCRGSSARHDRLVHAGPVTGGQVQVF